MIDNMSPEVYGRLKQAVELGKWPNGVKLTPEQTELCMQAVITYDYTNKPEEERVGLIVKHTLVAAVKKILLSMKQ
jgi:uncharacterized protein YeaC (DUF1315 family)